MKRHMISDASVTSEYVLNLKLCNSEVDDGRRRTYPENNRCDFDSGPKQKKLLVFCEKNAWVQLFP